MCIAFVYFIMAFEYFMIVLTAILIWVTYKIKKYLEPPPTPCFLDQWWGPGCEKNVDASVTPFKINISDEDLNDLKNRLNQTKPFTPPLEGIQFQYGFNTNTLTKIMEYWKNKYDWREREVYLNQYPQFKTNIQGLHIHFLHVKPENFEGKRILPLLIIHGWPGSFREFYKTIPLLVTPRPEDDFVFEVIVPSLPGYAFSDPATKPGLGPVQISVVFKNLMLRLGFNQFYVQGGDWGSAIATGLATIYPQHVLGFHLNLARESLTHWKTLLGSLWPSLFFEENFVKKMYPLKKFILEWIEESGYFHIQATKPDTIGVALQESPIGLAAYILQKFSAVTKLKNRNLEDGGLLEKFTYTDLLDNISIYWFTHSMTTSMRIYAEYTSRAYRALKIDKIPTQVPLGYARFPDEILIVPDELLKVKFKNIVHSSDMPRGGHFVALEEPQLLADHIWTTVKKMREIKN